MFAIALLTLLQACDKEKTETKILPVLSVSEVLDADVTFTSFMVSGSVSHDKNAITERGVCYSKSPNPKVTDTKIPTTTSNFKLEVPNLDVNTKYYIKTYAIVGAETFYSEKEMVKNTLSLAGTTWNFAFTYYPTNPTSPAVNWNGDVSFNANGTTKYDEPANPGLYLLYGTYTLAGNSINYIMEAPGNSGYVLVGKINGKTMSGTFNGGPPTKPNIWTATPKK